MKTRMVNWRHLRNLWLLLLLLMAGCASKSAPTNASTRTFTLGITSGAQEFVDFVMEGHGMLDQVGLKADKVKSLSPANLHLMVAERKVDIGFGGFTTMATARGEGKDLIVIYGVFSPVPEWVPSASTLADWFLTSTNAVSPMNSPFALSCATLAKRAPL